MPTMDSPRQPARRRHTARSKHRHHRQDHSLRPHRFRSREPEDPSLTVDDQPKHTTGRLVQSWLQGLQESKPRPVHEDGCSTAGGRWTGTSQAPAEQALQALLPRHGLQMPGEQSVRRSSPATRAWQRRDLQDRELRYESSMIATFQGHDRVRNHAGVSPHRSSTEECYYERGKKRHQTDPESDSPVSGASLPADHHFEKRARRKTRDDRYDVLDRKDDAGKVQEPRKKSGKKRRTRKHNLSTAREVMDRFSSKAILKDRITMQPSLRQGLFDNGRASKNELADLTFHEMAFLKQPRREPQKSISRSRENEKRRSERELEEVSAFFLHKNLSESYDASGRMKTAVSGLSGLDGIPGNSSALGSATQQYRKLSSRDNYDDGLVHYNTSQKERLARRGGGGSGQAPCSNRSADRRSDEPGYWSASELPERQQVRSSTPMQIREVLVRTGVFDNTGISDAKRQKQHEGSTKCFGDNTSNSVLSQKPSPYVVRVRPQIQSQPVCIVRYQDRGTMANEDQMDAGDHGREQLARCGPTDVQEALSNAVDQQLHKTSVTAPMSVIQTTITQPTQGEAIELIDGTGVDTKTTACEGRGAMGMERPKSPKWAVVEQLEAAADYLDAQDMGSDAAAGSVMQNLQQKHHATASYHDYPVSGHHNFVPNVRLLEQYQPAWPDQPNQPDSSQQHGQGALAEHQEDVPRRLICRLSPWKIQMPTQHAHSSLDDRNKPKSVVPLAPISSNDASSAPLAQRHDIKHLNPLAGSVPSPQTDMATSTSANCAWKASDSISGIQKEPVPWRNYSLLPQEVCRQQSMQDYIAWLEQDVLSRPQQDDSGAGTPTSQHEESQAYGVENLAHVDQVQGFQPFLEVGGQVGRLRESYTPPEIETPCRTSLHGRADVRYMQDEEEQSFTSNFWRPNRYPI